MSDKYTIQRSWNPPGVRIRPRQTNTATPQTSTPQPAPLNPSPFEQRLSILEGLTAALTNRVQELESFIQAKITDAHLTHDSKGTADGTMTIKAFCLRNSLSLSTYHSLKRAGQGPRRMQIGRRFRISYEAESEWRRKVEINPGNTDDKG